ncbi:MAG: hypothetical protein QG673_1116 [Pseudomonadota bacterium]|nr:hypothetical protein [Pseudomonadota bacterium]
MSHATSILLHFNSKNHKSAIFKLTELVDGIIAQFKEKQLDLAISLIKQHVEPGICNSVIRPLVFYTVLNCGKGKPNVGEYIRLTVAEFNESEESFIVENLNTQFIGYCPKKLSDIISKITLYELAGIQIALPH